jgi:hypothetical protein
MIAPSTARQADSRRVFRIACFSPCFEKACGLDMMRRA